MSAVAKPEVWTVGVCLFHHCAILDFQGPVELFGFLSKENIATRGASLGDPKIALDLHFLSVSMDPVEVDSGPHLVPTDVYSAEKQYDVLLIPGGYGATPQDAPKELLEFLKRQAPGVRYLLTACTGSYVLAATGLLDGKRATTNKSSYKLVTSTTSKAIQWVPKARWVIDGNFWSSSGVTAGADMANAFLIHIVGEKPAEVIRSIVELSAKGEGDDDWADYFHLV